MQIIILGMHRSGTSCVARLVNMMGAYFAPEGKEMLPQLDNPKGFWEREDVMQLNNDILQAAGGAWDLTAELDFNMIGNEQKEDFKQRIRPIVAEMDSHCPWFLKDPRMCLVLPFWLPFFDAPVFLFAHRNPIQIARSLLKRNGIPLFVGIALWEYYLTSALNTVKGGELVHTRYEDIMSDPVSEVKRLFDEFKSVGIKGLNLPNENDVISFITPELYNNRERASLYSHYLNHEQFKLIDVVEGKLNLQKIAEFDISKSSIAILQDYFPKHNLQEKVKKMEKQVSLQTAEIEAMQKDLSEVSLARQKTEVAYTAVTQELDATKNKFASTQYLLNQTINQLRLSLLQASSFGDLDFITGVGDRFNQIPGFYGMLEKAKLKVQNSRVDNVVEQLAVSGLFDTEYYLNEYPDVAVEEGVDPLKHFVVYGVFEGRKPNELFDPLFYLNENPDVVTAGINPLFHYYKDGWKEGRDPSRYFSTTYYLNVNPDVAESGQNPLAHFLRHGKVEGRQCHNRISVDGTGNDIEYEQTLGAIKPSGKGHRTTISRQVRSTTTSAIIEKEKFVSKRRYDNIKQKLTRVSPGTANTVELIKIPVKRSHKSISELQLPIDKKPEISILIPVYNAFEELAECLASIEKYVNASFEVIVVDDLSPDERIQKAFKGHQTIKYIRNEKNLGFLLNVNNAIAECRGRYIFLLNSDVQLLDDCPTILLTHLQNDPLAKITGPKIIYPNGALQEAGCCIHADCSTEMVGVGGDANAPQYNYNRYVDYISGACLCFSKEDFVSLGKFDGSFAPAYAEDLEFGARVLRNGGKIIYVAETTIMHHLSVSHKALSSSYKYYQSAINKQKFNNMYQEYFKGQNQIKPIVFYLPQFHCIKQNDFWWGAGYTEWRAVANAKPSFKSHYQPHVPSELGFYDLSHAEILEKQASLARRYGIHAFCFYYYNFGDHELLEKPLDTFLSSNADIKFCLCWANENWTRSWDGKEQDVLQEQKANNGDDFLNVLKSMERFIKDDRFLTIDGKPLILLYRCSLFTNITEKLATWREYWQKHHGTELYISLVDSMERSGGANPTPESLGFDAAVEFPVHQISTRMKLNENDMLPAVEFDGTLIDYSDAVLEICSRPHPGYKRFPGAFPSWDNTPRRGSSGVVFHNAHPSSFQAYVEHKCEEAKMLSGDERLLFINAWNEWGEGAHLEPDMEYGHSWLQALETAVKGS